MISRRNIRIKVMQNLYAIKALRESDKNATEKNIQIAQRQIVKNLEESNLIFIHLLYIMFEVAKYSEKDARQRSAKRRPTEEDLNVSTKLSQSFFVEFLQNSESFQDRVKKGLLPKRMESDFIKMLYGRLTAKEEYKTYIAQEGKDRKEEIEVLEELFATLLFDDEDFEQFMDDQYLQWQDDIPMMEILVSNFLKKPKSFNFSRPLSKEKRSYAIDLIRTVLEKQEYCQEWIKPRLKNWDVERVAIVDMLLLHMGVCEFLFFPTIPPRVTINEYIDLAKEYSTQQSGQFVNGVLDNILKTLKVQGKLNKIERRP